MNLFCRNASYLTKTTHLFASTCQYGIATKQYRHKTAHKNRCHSKRQRPISNARRRQNPYLLAIESETVKRKRPFARRRASTLRPLAVDILKRKPCLFTLFLFEGWYVLFIANMFFRFYSTFRTAKVTTISQLSKQFCAFPRFASKIFPYIISPFSTFVTYNL